MRAGRYEYVPYLILGLAVLRDGGFVAFDREGVPDNSYAIRSHGRSDGSDPETQTGFFPLNLLVVWGCNCKVLPERSADLIGTIQHSNGDDFQQLCGILVTRDKRVLNLNASCLKLATSENDNSSPLSTSVRRRKKCRVLAHWPHIICYPVSERQFCCHLCYEHSCRLNLNTSFHASPNSNARSIQRPSNHSRRTTQNPRISTPQVQITYRPLSGDGYVVYNMVYNESRS
jgi:hypothetical protein